MISLGGGGLSYITEQGRSNLNGGKGLLGKVCVTYVMNLYLHIGGYPQKDRQSHLERSLDSKTEKPLALLRVDTTNFFLLLFLKRNYKSYDRKSKIMNDPAVQVLRMQFP